MRHTGDRTLHGNPIAPSVDELGECYELDDRGVPMVWRAAQFTMAWVDGVWCRLDTWLKVRWIPLQETPSGPFFEVGPMDQCDFGDYRNAPVSGYCHRPTSTQSIDN